MLLRQHCTRDSDVDESANDYRCLLPRGTHLRRRYISNVYHYGLCYAHEIRRGCLGGARSLPCMDAYIHDIIFSMRSCKAVRPPPLEHFTIVQSSAHVYCRIEQIQCPTIEQSNCPPPPPYTFPSSPSPQPTYHVMQSVTNRPMA